MLLSLTSTLIRVQQVIKKYLPYTMILSVDHHAEGNNYDKFYDYEVHFSAHQEVNINNITFKISDIKIERLVDNHYL